MKHQCVSLMLICFVLVMHAKPAAAADNDHYVKYSLEVSVPITAALVGLAFGAEFYKKRYAPRRCHWCTKFPPDEMVRNALRWNYSETKTANMASNIVLASIPLLGLAQLAFIHDDIHNPTSGEWNGFGSASLIYAETLAISLALNQVSKLFFMRQRPYARNGSMGDSDANVSFYSGHTSTAFVLATAAATLNDMKGGNYRALTWSINLLLATTVGYLRIAADKHYFTDVLVGGIVGTLIGVLVPRLLHKKEKDDPQVKSNPSPYAPPPKPVMFGIGIPF
ncbi:phosphatase PAP2 family protein [Myxococcota bacterium]|nr:phosphatase PAP2 family protein [Myxococcota bacterium]MBU1534128.1 phosphatase PAP2 family protein [Myxococcota bacterium]